MSGTSVQQLREIGEAMGHKGLELTNFVHDQHTLEREDREGGRATGKAEAI